VKQSQAATKAATRQSAEGARIPVQSHPFSGEDLSVIERVIIAPTAGKFRPLVAAQADQPPAHIAAGEPIGFLDGPGGPRAVPSAFGGQLMGMLAHTGERVREGQPLAWLRTA
jgi:biotin carboxyl carrier protein